MLSRTDGEDGVRRRPTPPAGDGSEDAALPRQPPAGAVRGGVSDGADGDAGRIGAGARVAAVAGADGCDRGGVAHSGEPGRDTTGEAAHEGLCRRLEVGVGKTEAEAGLSSSFGDDALSPMAAFSLSCGERSWAL